MDTIVVPEVSAFEGAVLCGQCVLEYRNADWHIDFTQVLKFGTCEDCGQEHDSSSVWTRLVIASGAWQGDHK